MTHKNEMFSNSFAGLFSFYYLGPPRLLSAPSECIVVSFVEVFLAPNSHDVREEYTNHGWELDSTEVPFAFISCISFLR